MRFLFPVILIIIFFLIDLYLYQAVKLVISNYSVRTKKIIKWFFWAIPIYAITSFLLFVFARESVSSYFFIAAFLLYISKIISLIVLLLEDITRFIKLIYRRIKKQLSPKLASISEDENKISRSKFISQTALAIGGLHVGALAWGVTTGAHDYRIIRVTLPLKNLPTSFDGMTLAQISDIHSGSFYNKVAVQGGVELLMAEKPDMIFFTGDLVNNRTEEVKDYIEVFKKIKAPLGVFSSTGNHDYGDYAKWESEAEKKRNFENFKKVHQQLGWNLLQDEHQRIKVGNEEIGILGIQNWGVGFAQYGDLNKAIQNTEDLPVKLLLSHDPSHWREQVLKHTNIDAAFAGHTHGFQYGIKLGDFKFSPAQLRYKEWSGLYTENEQHLYVNTGFGYLGYPGRVGFLPEITIFELKKV